MAFVIIAMVTLPVEFDASFNRALRFCAPAATPEADMVEARRLLRAAACTMSPPPPCR